MEPRCFTWYLLTLMLNGPWMKLQPEKHMVTRACTPQGQGPGSFHQVRWAAMLAEDEETLEQILEEWRSICCSPETRGSSRGCDVSPQLFKCCWQITLSCSPLAAAAAAAKLLQSCPTLCDPIDGSPPGSPIPWIL